MDSKEERERYAWTVRTLENLRSLGEGATIRDVRHAFGMSTATNGYDLAQQIVKLCDPVCHDTSGDDSLRFSCSVCGYCASAYDDSDIDFD